MHLYDLVGSERTVAIASVLAATFVKGTAVLLLGTACSLLARGASAATRHMIWTLALGGALVVPIVSAVVPRWTVRVGFWPFARPELAIVADELHVPAALTGASSNVVLALAPRVQSVVRSSDDTPPPAIVAAPRAAAPEAAQALGDWRATTAGIATIESRRVTITSDAAVMPIAARAASPAAAPRSFIPWLAALWIGGALIALMPTAAGLALLTIVGRGARSLHGGRWALLIPTAMRELDVRRRVRFVELDGPVMPMTWGLFRPIVLLPADDFNSTVEQRLDVLRHELAHVRRYDCLTRAVGQLAVRCTGSTHWPGRRARASCGARARM
jgi:hypothetical protein